MLFTDLLFEVFPELKQLRDFIKGLKLKKDVLLSFTFKV
jgi:hypothetical protein